jgi:hypothetical protein
MGVARREKWRRLGMGTASRGGRWVWRLSRMLQASSVCRACRMGLLASVIAGNGLTLHSPAVWHLIWLPWGDWAVGVLGWMWPRLRVKPLFQDLRDLLHRAYQQAVFPNAIHHVFWNALQYWHRCFKTTFGRESERTHPNMFQLRQQVDRVFQPKTRRTVEKHYAELRTQRDPLVQAEPRLEPIFDSLARHHPTLVNAYDNALIPLTNNATERLIAALISTTKTLPTLTSSRQRGAICTCSS